MGDPSQGFSEGKKIRLVAIGILIGAVVVIYLGQLFLMQVVNNGKFTQDATGLRVTMPEQKPGPSDIGITLKVALA